MGLKLPDTVRIGGIDFVSSEVEGLNNGEQGLNGTIMYNESQIKLEAALSDQEKFATLWHEVVHGLLVHAGWDDHDEKQVQALGYGIAQVLRDNPLLRWMEAGEE